MQGPRCAASHVIFITQHELLRTGMNALETEKGTVLLY
jgi:hypothetical protein